MKRRANLGLRKRVLEELGGIPSAVGVADINDWLAERVIRRKMTCDEDPSAETLVDMASEMF